MLDIKKNPRPNHKITRCCGTCKFFVQNHNYGKNGACALPDGPKLTNNPSKDLKKQVNKLDPTHMYCYCDNHQWRPMGYLRAAIVYSGVDPNEIK